MSNQTLKAAFQCVSVQLLLPLLQMFSFALGYLQTAAALILQRDPDMHLHAGQKR